MNIHELVIKRSPFVFLKWLAVIEFFFAFLPSFIVLLFDVQREYENLAISRTFSFNFLVIILLTSLQILIIIVAFIAWYFPTYYANKREILYKRGDMFESRRLAYTPHVVSVKLKQGIFAKRLNYGTLEIATSDRAEKVRISGIPNPDQYAEMIEKMVEPALAQLQAPESKSVRALIAGGEDQHVEFKSSLMWDYRQQKANKALYEPVMKNIVGYMNTVGGTVLVGVDDEGGILGLDPDFKVMRKGNPDGFENVFNMAFNKMVGVEFRQFVDVTFPELDEQYICMITVRPATRPAYLTDRGKETFYIRAGNASQPLSVSKAVGYIQTHFDAN